MLVNANGTVVNANAIALETFEAPGTALVGRGLLDLLPSFDSRRIPGSMRRPDTGDDGRTKPTRMVARRTDGTEFPVEVTSANLEDGRTPYADPYHPYTGDELLMLVVRDLTGTMDTEAELARQQRQTEMILRAASEGVVGVDTEGKVVLVNPSAAQILGFRASDLGGQELHPLIHHSRADGTPLPYEETPLADTLRSGRKHRVRGQVLWTKDKRAVPVDLTTAPVREADQLVGAVMTFTDRTPFDALVARHTQLRAVLDASLRGPLEELRAELGALADDPAGQLWPEANQTLHHLAAGYARMTTLIDNVLAFQQLDSGKEKLDRRPTGLDKVVAAGVEGAVELIGPGRAQFAVHAPPVEAVVDAVRLAQALSHLIADVAGVDATGRTAVVAGGGDSTIVVAAARRGDVVRIEVRGPHSGGSPVHVPITRGIVERHGGVLQTHEVPGQGSAYVLEVPVGETGDDAGGGPGGATADGEGARNRESETTVMPMPAEPARGTRGPAGASAGAPGAGAGGAAGAGTPTGPGGASGTGADGARAGGVRPSRPRRRPVGEGSETADGDGGAAGGGAAPGTPAGSAIALPAGPSGAAAAGGPGNGGVAGASGVPGAEQPTGRRRALRRADEDVPEEAPQSAVRPPSGRRARRALADGQQGARATAPATPGGHPAPGDQPELTARPSAHALPPGGATAGEPPADAAWPGHGPVPGPATGMAPVPPQGQGRGGRGAGGPGPVSAQGGPGLPATVPAQPTPSGRRAKKPAGQPEGNGPVALPPGAGYPAGGGAAVTGPGQARHGVPGARRAPGEPAAGHDTPGHDVPAGTPAHGIPAQHGTPAQGTPAHTTPAHGTSARPNSGTPDPGAPATGAPTTNAPATGSDGHGISVRTLGQGVAFTHPLPGQSEPPRAGQAVPLPAQQPAAGSGRRRRHSASTDPQPAPEHAPGARPHPTEGSVDQVGAAEPVPGSNPAFQTSDSEGQGQAFAIGAPADGAEGPEMLDGPGGAVEVRTAPAADADGDDEGAPPTPIAPRRLLVWPEPDVSTRQALTDRGYRPVTVRSREEVDAQVAEYPAALFVDPLTGPITRTALQSLRAAAVAAEVPVLVTAGLGQATREAAYGADPAVLLKALAPRDSEQHPPRVLLVESHQDIAAAFTATLERRGMQVAHAASEGDAATIAAQIRPNLVVMDLMLIRRRRVGIVDWLRSNGLLTRTPLVVYTSVDIDAAELPRLGTGETVLFLAERSTSGEVQGRIVDLLSKIGTDG
nr:PAS domain-containing protein [Streptomyces sp. SID5468]